MAVPGTFENINKNQHQHQEFSIGNHCRKFENNCSCDNPGLVVCGLSVFLVYEVKN